MVLVGGDIIFLMDDSGLKTGWFNDERIGALVAIGLGVFGLGIFSWFFGRGNFWGLFLIPIAFIFVPSGLAILSAAVIRKLKSKFFRLLVLMITAIIISSLFVGPKYFGMIFGEWLKKF